MLTQRQCLCIKKYRRWRTKKKTREIETFVTIHPQTTKMCIMHIIKIEQTKTREGKKKRKLKRKKLEQCLLLETFKM